MGKKFKVQPGRLIQSHGCEIISEHSSDEACIRHLKRRPESIAFFVSYPENWKKLVEDYTPRQAGEPLNDEVEETVVDEIAEAAEETIEETAEEEVDEVTEMTNKELKAELTEAGIEIPKQSKKSDLVDLVKAHRNNV